MKRTQQEILDRFEKADDFLGTQKGDLVDFMEWEYAKPFLKKDYVEEVESGKEKWEVKTDAKGEILDYLEFAYNKANNERGISAGRSMLHFKTWIWLDDLKFYDEIVEEIDDYYDYGIPVLDKIAKYYGWKKSKKKKEVA